MQWRTQKAHSMYVVGFLCYATLPINFERRSSVVGVLCGSQFTMHHC